MFLLDSDSREMTGNEGEREMGETSPAGPEPWMPTTKPPGHPLD